MRKSNVRLQQGEIMEQITYLKKLIDATRLRAAGGYPHFILWGFIWIIGNIAGTFGIGRNLGWIWMVLCSVGGVTSIVLGIISRRNTKYAPTLLGQLRFLNLILGDEAGLFFPMCFYFDNVYFGAKTLSIYVPFWIGVIYIANGIFIGKELIWIGLWIAFEALIALAIPFPFFYIWLALAGGGSLLVTGFIFRKQVKARG